MTERPYPEGIAWDEALRQRQRQRADADEACEWGLPINAACTCNAAERRLTESVKLIRAAISAGEWFEGTFHIELNAHWLDRAKGVVSG